MVDATTNSLLVYVYNGKINYSRNYQMKKFNYYAAAFASSLVLTLLVITVEISPPFKDILTSILKHHWIAKLAITTLTFIATGLLLKNQKKLGKYLYSELAWKSTIAALLTIFGFYILHFLLIK